MKDDLIPPSQPPKDIRDLPPRHRYEKIKRELDLKWRRRDPMPERMMRESVDHLWDAFSKDPWTWCGMWTLQPDGRGLLPGPGRDEAPQARPLEGLIADCFTGKDSKLGQDGGTHAIAVPVMDMNGRPWAVFVARASAPFNEVDARWIEQVLKAFRAIKRPEPPPLS